jgi:hypothetical protein
MILQPFKGVTAGGYRVLLGSGDHFFDQTAGYLGLY